MSQLQDRIKIGSIFLEKPEMKRIKIIDIQDLNQSAPTKVPGVNLVRIGRWAEYEYVDDPGYRGAFDIAFADQYIMELN